MQNEVEKAKQHADISLHPEVANSGVAAVHEDEYYREVSAALQSAHPEADISKDAVVPATEPTPNLIRFPERPAGRPMEDTTWGKAPMAQKLREIFARRQKKGELLNAA